VTRPADWDVLDLSGDPTPGEPFAVGVLSVRVGDLAEDAARAERDVRALAGDGAVTSWVGLAGEVFRGALEDFPVQLRKLADSYELCASALSRYAGALDGAQDQADRALALGRVARAEIEALSAQLSVARGAASSAGSNLDVLSRPVADGALPPDPEQVRAATRSAQAAAGRVTALSGAQERLEVAEADGPGRRGAARSRRRPGQRAVA
jgi:uncharacterized protein YukE